MKYLPTVLISLCLGLFQLQAQDFSIAGKVVDSNDEIIPFANILLLNAADSTFVKGTSANDQGLFVLEAVAPNLYLLQASYIGRGSKPLALDVKADIRLGALVIPKATEDLDEVVVTARRPTVRRLTDRLVFDVENTVVSQGTSWDILKNTPGVIVNQEELMIRGQSATIYLNDRKVQLSGDEAKELLEGLSGVNIQSVEVIPNPPARYEAESGPILNIVTSKTILPGYKGSLNGSYTQAVFPKYSFGTSHYFKTDKLNFFANYTVNPKKELRKTDKGIRFLDANNAAFSIWDTENQETNRAVTHTGTLITDYTFSDKTSLNLTSTVFVNPDQETNSSLRNSISTPGGVLDSTFTTTNGIATDSKNLAVDLTLNQKLGDKGAKLVVNGHLTEYSLDFFQQIGSDYFDGSGAFLRSFSFDTDSEQDISIRTGQVDFLTPLGTASFEAGAKYSSIASESRIVYDNFQGSDPSVNEGLSDAFNYDEQVFALYLSWFKSWEKWSLKLGTRGELTDATGESLTLGSVNRQDFFELFPSINLLHTPNENHSFSIDYGRRLERPRYNDLNPFRNFINENDFEEGNPSLRPYFSNNFNFNYTYNNVWFFDLYYRDNGETINYLVFQDNDALTLRELKQNVLDSQSYGLDITYSNSILDAWYLFSYVSFFHEDETFLAVESGNQPFTNEVDGVYAQLSNYLTLSGDGSLTGEVSLSYLSNFLFGSYVSDEQLNLTLGLRKSLWNDRATVSIAAEDLLESYVPTYTSRYLNQDNFYRRRPETQFIRVGFTYNFGNFRLEDNQREIDKKERERINGE
ncbi:MAG: TonB-dependent receptor [Flavobacteriaceae bacterium]|nr:TonB-dependent receptor [Flavobacteriaceae bacterium]